MSVGVIAAQALDEADHGCVGPGCVQGAVGPAGGRLSPESLPPAEGLTATLDGPMVT